MSPESHFLKNAPTYNLIANNFIANYFVANKNITYLCARISLIKDIMDDKAFVFGIATFGEHFTDRKEETKRLLSNFNYGVNTILISPRRIGKTSLVQKVARIAQSDTLKMVYFDAFSCRSESEFYSMFASAVLKQTSSRFEEFVENAKAFITNITPKFNVGTDPFSDFSLSLEWSEKADDVNEILQLPEKLAQKKGIRIVVCIDEFQQIADFADSLTFQKRLRSVWQLQKSVSYCLFGSKHHLMNELFEKRSYPFYKFGDVIYLNKIPTPDWVEYICARFKATGKEITPTLAEKISLAVSNHSSYVQQLAWLTWIYTDKVATEASFNEALIDLLNQNSLLFEKQVENLSSYQLNFLRALLDGVTSEFSSQEVLGKYELGSSANATVIKRALVKREIIDVENKKVSMSDPVMALWLKQKLNTNFRFL